MTHSHLTPTQLHAYLAGTLPAEERRRLQLHLASCQLCDEALRQEDQIRRGFQRDFVPPALPQLNGTLTLILKKSQHPTRYQVNWAGILIAMILSAMMILPFLPTLNEVSFSTQPDVVNEPLATGTQVNYSNLCGGRVCSVPTEDVVTNAKAADDLSYAASPAPPPSSSATPSVSQEARP